MFVGMARAEPTAPAVTGTHHSLLTIHISGTVFVHTQGKAWPLLPAPQAP